MSVHPIEFRYYYPAMRALFTEEAKLQNWLRVEAELSLAQARLGHIPKAAAAVIRNKATVDQVRLSRVKAIESVIHHDLMAMVKALSEACGQKAGKYVHLGATSYDIEDTALALQLSAALDLIRADARALLKTLMTLARRTRKLVCVGRTHGQHAVPTTYGLKFAVYASEMGRHLARLAEVQLRIRVGKLSGAVGTQASFGPAAPQLQRMLMKALGLSPVMVANQVIQRDRHAEVVFTLALLAATAEKIGREIRNLQRSEIGELSESFQPQQVGSSAMPQKRNPHKSERVCSLARIIRAYVAPALENIPLEHERDLTNSAAERVIFPEAFILTDYLLRQLNEILRGLQIHKQAIQRNLGLTGGAIMSERIMLELVKRGLGRQEAHEILRQAAQKVLATGQTLKNVLQDDKRITKVLTEQALLRCLDPASYIGTAVTQVDTVLAALRRQ